MMRAHQNGRSSRMSWLSFAVMLACLAAPSSQASEEDRSYFALEAIARQCPVIVTGTLLKVDVTEGESNATGHIVIEWVDKNLLTDVPLAGGGIVQAVFARLPAGDGKPRAQFAPGLRGVWVLYLGDQGEFRLDRSVLQFQPLMDGLSQGAYLSSCGYARRDGDKKLTPVHSKADFIAARRANALVVDTSSERLKQDGALCAAAVSEFLRDGNLSDDELKRFAALPFGVRRQLFNFEREKLTMDITQWAKLRDYVLLHDPVENMRSAAASRHPEEKGVSAPLLRALRDPAPGVRGFACQAIASAPDEMVGDAIQRMLDDPSPEVRESAVNTLGQLGNRARLAAIIACYGRDGGGTRIDWTFARAFLKLGEQRLALSCAVNAMRSENPNIRDSAMRVIANVELPEIVLFLVPVLAEEDAALESMREWRANDPAMQHLQAEVKRRTGQPFGPEVLKWLEWWNSPNRDEKAVPSIEKRRREVESKPTELFPTLRLTPMEY